MLFEDIVSLNSPHTKSMLKLLFEERGIRIKKQWGQNFLIDQNLLQFIAKTAELSRNDVVLEIGAGTGSLTKLIAENAGHVFAVELDRKLFEILTETLKDFDNVTLINRDILKSKHHIQPEIVEAISDYVHTAPPEPIRAGTSATGDLCIKVISNLPYYISTPVIIDLLQEVLPIKTMVLTLQRDTTNRMVAHPGTRNYGILSIMTKLFADVKVLKKLPPDVFWPVPLVDSAIVKMTVNRHRYADRIHDYPGFQDVVRSIYSSRRKTLSNSLLSLCASHGIKKNPARTCPNRYPSPPERRVGLANGTRQNDTVGLVAGRAGGPARIGSGGETRQDLVTILERVGIRPESRGEELDLEKLIELSNEISDYVNSQKNFV